MSSMCQRQVYRRGTGMNGACCRTQQAPEGDSGQLGLGSPGQEGWWVMAMGSCCADLQEDTARCAHPDGHRCCEAGLGRLYSEYVMPLGIKATAPQEPAQCRDAAGEDRSLEEGPGDPEDRLETAMATSVGAVDGMQRPRCKEAVKPETQATHTRRTLLAPARVDFCVPHQSLTPSPCLTQDWGPG